MQNINLTESKIRARLAEIDHEHFTLTESLTQAPAQFEESRSGDDNAVESEGTEQELASIGSKIRALEKERDELHAELASFKPAA